MSFYLELWECCLLLSVCILPKSWKNVLCLLFEFIENMWKKRSVVKEQCFDSTNKWTLWSSRVTQLTGFNYHFQQCWGKIHFKSNRISNLKSISCKSNESVRQKTWLLSSFIYLYKLKIIINCWNWKTCGSNDISTMELQTIWKLGVKDTNEFSCHLANLIYGYVFYRQQKSIPMDKVLLWISTEQVFSSRNLNKIVVNQ